MRHLNRLYVLAAILVTSLGVVVAPSPTYASVSWAAAGFTALAAILYGLRAFEPPHPTAWHLLAVSFGCWGVAAALFPLAGVTASSTTYRLGDLMYAPGYLAIALSTVALSRRMGPIREVGLEAAIGTLALSSFLWSLVIEPNLQTGGAKGALGAVFPICDLALLMLLLRVVFSPLVGLRAVRLLAAGALLLVTSDILYFSPVIQKGEALGRAINALYVAAYFVFGAAALHRSMRRLPARRPLSDEIAPRRLMLVLGCAPLTTPIAVVFTEAVDGTPDAVPLAVIGAATVLLVLIRIWRLLRHVDALRLRAEASEQRFRMVFDSAGQGMSIGSHGMMTETNAALRRMLGYTSEELAPLHYTDVTHPDDRTLAEDASEEVMSGQRVSHTFEKRLLRKDGSSFWVSVTLSRARDGSFGISIINDITARKELEAELRQAQKMEAVGKLAGGIAHDFNNVMTAVSACADLLRQEIDADDPRHERVDVIAESASRATELTRQLLAFSRRQVLRLEPVDLADAVSGMEAMLDRLLPPNIALACDLEPGAVVRVDRPQLEQVVLNLVLNARDAMPDGGKLAVSVRSAGDTAELTVADDGAGMDDDTMSRIFEPFFTTKRAGTGLGLATVDGIVAQSGGTLSVSSEPGRGSIFTIALPRLDVPAPSHPAPSPKPGSTTPGRILLADDEELVRRVTTEMLRRLGYDVVAACSGEEALELLDPGIDALVTDVAMTGMNGKALAERARERRPGLPVLFVSGYPAEVLTGERMVADGDEVLSKPFTPAQLAERIELVRRRAAQPVAA
jgi:PAS domain S-box-containing protein